MSSKRNLTFITITISILFGVLYLLVPVYGDDLWYMIRAKDCLSDPIKACMLTYEETICHLDYDTGRLSNLLSPPWLCLLPRWIFALVNTVIIYFSISFGYKIVGGLRGSFRKYLFLSVFVVILPWFDYMLTIMFTLNYLWTTLLLLIVIWYFSQLADGNNKGKGFTIAMLAVCFVTGWMHEGASVPLAAALFAYFFINRKVITRRVILSYLSLICGIIVLISFPAIWQRSSSGALKLFTHPLNEALLSIVAFNCMFYSYCIVLVYAIIKKRIVTAGQKASATFYLVYGISSTLIFIIFYGGPRVGWFNQLVCGIGVLWLLGLFRGKITCKALITASKCVVSSFLILHLIFAIVRQSELKSEFDSVLNLIKGSSDATVYYDIIKPKADLTLYKTSVRGLNERLPLIELSEFYCGGKQLRILPSDLKDFIPEKFIRDKILVYKEKYIITDIIPSDVNIIKIKSDGSWMESRFRTVILYAPEQGDTLHWVLPHIQTMSPDISIDDARW